MFLQVLRCSGKIEEVKSPDSLPTLSAGAHDADTGSACVMEYVSLLAGEQWSDRPECTHPILAHEARVANDLLLDGDRPRLVPLIGRLFGTTEDSSTLRARLRLTQARRVAALVDKSERARITAAITHAEAVLDGLEDELTHDQLYARCIAFPVAEGELDVEHWHVHKAASRVFAFGTAPDVESGEAHALYALVVAHRIAAGQCQADCGDAPSRGRRMVKDLGALVDTYDTTTGRTSPKLDVTQVRDLIAHVR